MSLPLNASASVAAAAAERPIVPVSTDEQPELVMHFYSTQFKTSFL